RVSARRWDPGGVDRPARPVLVGRRVGCDPAVDQFEGPPLTPGVHVRAEAPADQGGGLQLRFWHDFLHTSNVPDPGGSRCTPLRLPADIAFSAPPAYSCTFYPTRGIRPIWIRGMSGSVDCGVFAVIARALFASY